MKELKPEKVFVVRKVEEEEITKLALESCPIENLTGLEKYFSPINTIREWERRGFEIGFMKALTLPPPPARHSGGWERRVYVGGYEAVLAGRNKSGKNECSQRW